MAAEHHHHQNGPPESFRQLAPFLHFWYVAKQQDFCSIQFPSCSGSLQESDSPHGVCVWPATCKFLSRLGCGAAWNRERQKRKAWHWLLHCSDAKTDGSIKIEDSARAHSGSQTLALLTTLLALRSIVLTQAPWEGTFKTSGTVAWTSCHIAILLCWGFRAICADYPLFLWCLMTSYNNLAGVALIKGASTTTTTATMTTPGQLSDCKLNYHHSKKIQSRKEEAHYQNHQSQQDSTHH